MKVYSFQTVLLDPPLPITNWESTIVRSPDYNEALRIDPKNQDTLANRGLLYMMMSDAKRALNGFERARSRVRAPDAAFL